MTSLGSICFAQPLTDNQDPHGELEFARHFGHHGYDTVMASGFWGLRGRDDDAVLAFLQRTFGNAEDYEQLEGTRAPRLMLDIRGFRLNTNATIRDLCEESDYVNSYHVIDEPDAHVTGHPDEFTATPKEVAAICRGTLDTDYGKPLCITFENQAGKPGGRKWNYIKNTDELYRSYIDTLKGWHKGPNAIGIDYYQFSRALVPPRDQLSQFEMMRYFTNLVGPDDYAFAWGEVTFQGLGYI